MKALTFAVLVAAFTLGFGTAVRADGHWGDGYCPNNMRQWCEQQYNGSFYCTCQCYPGQHSQYCP